ncbi:MAG TPA: NAD(P)/FAD-dependent oxidoreductase, partial [Euryarchaeota archaeon]|nr:NAD(P)/FAD-dependent oxidoreductase [Euryarchaeota archaeon]
MDYDCVIAGGGPAGSYLARHIAPKMNVLIIEEHIEVGRPVQCAGIISPASVKFAGYPQERCRDLKKAVIVGPQGDSVVIRGSP